VGVVLSFRSDFQPSLVFIIKASHNLKSESPCDCHFQKCVNAALFWPGHDDSDAALSKEGELRSIRFGLKQPGFSDSLALGVRSTTNTYIIRMTASSVACGQRD